MAGQLSRRESELRPWWSASPLAGLRQEMDQLVSEFFGDKTVAAGGMPMLPSLDLSESDEDIEVKMDLPGYKAEEIHVDLNRNVLTVSGEHSEETKKENQENEGGRRFHRIERRSGSFHRSVQLPALVNQEGVEANFRDGVLTITLKKAEQSKSQKITVKT